MPSTLSPTEQHLLFAFAAVVRKGSFTAAAEHLGVTKSVVSAHVRSLESKLGVRLLERSTRRMRITQIGRSVFETASRMVELNAELGALIASQGERPVGTLRVGAQTNLGARFVSPVLAAMCREHPELDVDVYYDDREVDMIDSVIEVSVRLGVPKDSRLIAKKLADDREVIVAAPNLAGLWSGATRPTELRDAPWLAHREVPTKRSVYTGPGNTRSTLNITRQRLVSSTVSALIHLAQAGVGFVALPKLLTERAVSEGSLVRVLPGWFRRRVGVYAVRPSRTNTPVRVTMFIDAMVIALRELRDGS